ncbi:MAG: hypothetical protein WBA24_01880 [Geitlerinemataceae cyanobacterium]
MPEIVRQTGLLDYHPLYYTEAIAHSVIFCKVFCTIVQNTEGLE